MTPEKNVPTFGSLSGRIACITGSSSGIGQAIAREFARAGANILLHCRTDATRLLPLQHELRESGVQVACLAVDLSHSDGPAQLLNQAWNTWNGVDLWINNAGVDLLTGPDAKLDYAAKLHKLLEVDVTATALLSRGAGTRLKDRDKSVLLNIGWDQADRGMEGDSGELFALAKNAVMGLTRSLAVSLAPQVRVNCIAPGWIKTAWGETAPDVWQSRVMRETPLARWGMPADIAKLARFLCSDDASYITGQVINCNGGAVR